MADFVVLATADWDHPLWTNKQHTAQALVAEGHRVLYVESLGLRPPRVGAADRTRILRRLRRMVQPPRLRQQGLWVWSPPVLPGGHKGLALALNRLALQLGLAFARRWLGFQQPILWTYNPLTHLYLDLSQFSGSVYHCVDRIQDQPGMPVDVIEVNEALLSKAVDVIFVTSPELEMLHRHRNARTFLFGNVADHEHFSTSRLGLAGKPLPCPKSLATKGRPRLLFIGAIDAYKLDLDMLTSLAGRHPEWEFVLIGPVGECDPSTDVSALQALSNVHLAGPVAYSDLPSWLAHADLALLPLQVNGYTRHMFPMKFFEYLSSGLPVVATAIPSLQSHRDVALLCSPDVESFEQAIALALKGGGPDLQKRLQRASTQTYQVRTEKMLTLLKKISVLRGVSRSARVSRRRVVSRLVDPTIGSSARAKKVVLYIDSLKLGGAERVTLSWAEWLYQAGWMPIVLTRKPVNWDFYPLPDGIKRVVEPDDPTWMKRMGALAFPCRVLRLQRWLDQMDACLTIGITSLPAIKLLFASRLLGVPCVVSERNYPPMKPIGRVWSALRRIAYPWAALHIVQTRAVGAWLSQHVGAHHQLLLPNSVSWPLTCFHPCVDPREWLASAGASHAAPFILGVGTKSVQKGFDRLVRWWIPLALQYPKLQLVIIGLDEGLYKGLDQQAALRALLVDHPQLLGRLHFPGRVGNVVDWYACAQVFVLASRYEGFPNVLLEAMAAGCCCAAVDCPQGPGDLINDGVNGRLLPEGASDEQWVQQLKQLLDDPALRQRLSAQAVEVRESYAPVELRKRLMQALEQVVAEAETIRDDI
jgi:glycosyltransferase involved in cell wall biosynthesis